MDVWLNQQNCETAGGENEDWGRNNFRDLQSKE